MIQMRGVAALAASAMTAIAIGQVTINCFGPTTQGENCGPVGADPGGLIPLGGPIGGPALDEWAWPLCVWKARTLECAIGSNGGWWDAYCHNGQVVLLDEDCRPAGKERYLYDVFTNGGYDGTTYDCDEEC